jgi:hypothetical protein
VLPLWPPGKHRRTAEAARRLGIPVVAADELRASRSCRATSTAVIAYRQSPASTELRSAWAIAAHAACGAGASAPLDHAGELWRTISPAAASA